MASGEIDLERAVAGYYASVESTWNVVTDYVGQWLEDDLTVVVTADHGETWGRLRDWTMYGHPNRVHVRPLTEVPWVVFQQAAPIADDTAGDVEEKLEALGYV